MTLHPEDWQTIRACCKDEAAFTKVHALLTDRLRQQDAGYQAMLDSLPVGMVATDSAGLINRINRAMLDMVGQPRDAVLGHHAGVFVPPAVRDQFNGLGAVAAPASGYSADFDIQRQDGKVVPAHVQLIPLHGPERGVAGWLAVATDMTAYRQAEDALRHSEKRYRQTVENSPNPIFAVNYQGVILSWNSACEEHFSYSRAETVGQPYTMLLQTPDERTRIAASVRSVFQTRVMLADVHITFQRRDGSGRLMLSRLYPVLAEDGSVQECVFANSDITEQKLAEERLRQSEGMYQALVASLPRMVVCLFDHNRRLMVVGGQGLAEIELGNTSALLGTRPEDVLPAHAAAYLEPRFQEVLRGQELHFEAQFREHLYDIHVLPVYIPDHDVVLAGLLVARDVTQERQAEAALRSSEHKLRSLIDRSDDGIVLVNYDGRVAEWNASQERITGVPAADAIGHFVWEVQGQTNAAVDADRAALIEQARAAIMPILEHGYSDWLNHVMEQVIRRPDGEERIIQTVSFSLSPESGSGALLGGITRDVTEQRRAEREALMHDVERERLRLLTEFITSASHEFRTPLSIINLKLHLIRRLTGEANVINDHLDGISDQVSGILRLVESLLRMSRLDPAAERNFFPIRLSDVLRSVIVSLSYHAEAKNAHLKFDTELASALPYIVADPDALHTAFYNIIDNAVRYTPPDGTITVRALAQPDGALCVDVSDTGAGIEAEHLPHIFEAFYRADKARTTPGLGLGLTIARQAVELHGGEIRIASVPGKGTTVTVLLPAALVVARAM
jgi:PAS domain S-box-containing protein